MRKGAEIQYHDPFVPEVRDDGEVYRSVPLTDRLLRSCDCVVIATDHSVIDYKFVVEHSLLVVDTRNATRSHGGDNVVGLSGIVPPVDGSEDEVEASA